MTPDATSLARNPVVLVIGTGGTIASESTSEGYQPVGPFSVLHYLSLMASQLRNDSFYRRIRHHPQLSDSTCSLTDPITTVQIGPNLRYPRLTTPALDDVGAVVSYDILDLENHMDSSEMTPVGKSVYRPLRWRIVSNHERLGRILTHL